MRLNVIALALVLTACGPESVSWTEAYDATGSGWILSVWGPETGERFAVGGRSPEQGVVTRYDGQQWDEIALPADTPLLNWAFGFSASDVTVVGYDGAILHFDGSEFSAMPSPTTERLWGVWGASPDDMWAVGGLNETPVLLHFDGTSWTLEDIPELQRGGVNAFFKVWGSSASDVWVVGQSGVILHYDGSAWAEMGAGTGEDLISIWGTGPNEVYAVGGRGNGVIAAYDGTSWRSENLSPQPGLNGVWTDGNRLVAVGERGTVLEFNPETLEIMDATSESRLTLHAVFGESRAPTPVLTTVGGNLAEGPNAPTFIGLALEKPLN